LRQVAFDAFVVSFDGGSGGGNGGGVGVGVGNKFDLKGVFIAGDSRARWLRRVGRRSRNMRELLQSRRSGCKRGCK